MPSTQPAVRTDLRADCDNCFALCCVAAPFSVSADFPIDKQAGEPCRNLTDDLRCGIHAELRPRGFVGCTVYDCFGAGQKVSQQTFGGRDWRDHPEQAQDMFATAAVMRQLHEVLWYLSEASRLPAARPLRGELLQAMAEIELLTYGDGDTVLAVDVDGHRARVGEILIRASELARAGIGGPKRNLRGAELLGADFAGADLRGANLRGTRLIGAVLRDADLRLADLTGADVRGADLTGADLRGALFVTQAQLDAVRGDARTRVPEGLARPAHWRTD